MNPAKTASGPSASSQRLRWGRRSRLGAARRRTGSERPAGRRGRSRTVAVTRGSPAGRGTPRPTARRSGRRSGCRDRGGTRRARRSRRRCGPGRADMTSTRLERNTASWIEWVMNSPAKRSCRKRRWSSSLSRSRVISSRAPNGSSKKNSWRVERERAGQRHPHPHAAGQPLRVALLEAAAGPPARWPRPPCGPARPASMPCSSQNSSTLRSTVRHGSSVASWNT